MDNKIIGIIYPLPNSVISRLFDKKKNVVVKFTPLDPNKEPKNIKLGHKLFFYKSQSNKEIVGFGIIERIQFLDNCELLKEHRGDLALTEEELKEYVGARRGKKMLVLSLKNISELKKPVYLRKQPTINGKYMTQEMHNRLFKNK